MEGIGRQLGELTHLLFLEEIIQERDNIVSFLDVTIYEPHRDETESYRGTAFLTERGVILLSGPKTRFRCDFYPYKTIKKMIVDWKTEGKLDSFPHIALFVGKDEKLVAVFESYDLEHFDEFKQLLLNKAYGSQHIEQHKNETDVVCFSQIRT